MNWLRSFLFNVATSLLFSVVIFIITVSLITGKFPPDWAKLGKTFENAQKALKASQSIMARTDWDQINDQLEGNKPLIRTATTHEARLQELESENEKLRSKVRVLETRLQNIENQVGIKK